MTLNRTLLRDYLVLIIGTLLLSASYALFLVPAHISAGGVTGASRGAALSCSGCQQGCSSSP